MVILGGFRGMLPRKFLKNTCCDIVSENTFEYPSEYSWFVYCIAITYIVKDRKKATKQGSKYCSVECVIYMTGDTVHLAFNYLSYKFLFDSAKHVI